MKKSINFTLINKLVKRYQTGDSPGIFNAINYLLLALLFSTISSCSNKNKISFRRGELNEVFELAKKTNKKVFVLITDSTCGSCLEFENFLHQQSTTCQILNRDYICYKANIRNSREHKIAEIVKCPSYPFPYFFDADGNLLAFGFPNKKEYDISDLNEITIDKYRFPELFHLEISANEYKTLVSMNMKATLLLNTKSKVNVLKSYNLFKESLNISSYPYNIRYTNLLSNKSNKDILIKRPLNSNQNASDKFLYGDISKYTGIGTFTESALKTSRNKDTADYVLDQTRDLGKLMKSKSYEFSFKIKNLSKRPLVILNVQHPCDCIKLNWSKSSIRHNETAFIKGTFTPYESGTFHKEIFVHNNSLLKPMGIFEIQGTVN